MSDTTKIQWADATFNPWIGCTKVSPGCKNCYAENTTRARVLRGQGHETWGKGAKRSRTSDALWKKPLQWNRVPIICPTGNIAIKGAPGGHGPYVPERYDLSHECCECGSKLHRMRVFPSLCDWLDDEVPVEYLADFLKLIHDTPNLDWLLLTKRPENWTSRIDAVCKLWACDGSYRETPESRVYHDMLCPWRAGKPPENIWFGVSAENQEQWDKRVGQLVKIPATVRFVSAEPLLGAIDMSSRVYKSGCEPHCGEKCSKDADCPLEPSNAVHWVIFGGESGPGARPCDIGWIGDGLAQCSAAGVKAFCKQLGSKPVGTYNLPNRIKDPKGGDMAEWPEDLRVREMPA